MPKKRKLRSGASSANTNESHGNAFEDRKGSKLKMASWQDVMDSEDEFLEGREKILLDEGPARKRTRQMREEEMALDASDEEVLGLEGSDDYDDEEEKYAEEYDSDGAVQEEEYDEDVEITGKSRNHREKDDEETGWGTSRNDLYGEDEMESEEAALAQEKEAMRIQQKQLEEMNDEDFGFGDGDWMSGQKQETDEAGAAAADEHFLERLPEASLADDASAADRNRLLKERYPEFEPLKNEFLELQTTFVELREVLTERNAPVVAVKYQALAAYLGILSMYFALLTSTATEDGKAFAIAPMQLRDHEIMQGLVQARSTWMAAQDLEDEESIYEDSESEIEQVVAVPEISRLVKKTKKAKPLSAAELAQAASVARRAARVAAAEADFADLEMKAKMPAAIRAGANFHRDDSELEDDSRLNAHEAAAKAAKKKSLRYYTSEITQKANRRQARGNEVGGDADIPHREKWYDRQMRLQAEAQQRKEQVMEQRYGEGADGRKDKDAGADDLDDEYQTLVSRAQKVKSAKKTAATEEYALQAAARDAGFLAAETEIGPDGKRKITYQIEKNKGLAPHRKKDVRNPRVKKRNKYEEKKKKLGSTKAVYKGGPGKGGYQGELTGIKTGLVKSIKLS